MDQESRRMGLTWKIGGIYTGVMVVLGAFVIAAVYLLTQSTLRDQLDKRALAIVTNFSDAAAGHVAGRNLLALHALARKYTLLDAVAYAYVEDGKGEIVVHTLETFPQELRQEISVETGDRCRQPLPAGARSASVEVLRALRSPAITAGR